MKEGFALLENRIIVLEGRVGALESRVTAVETKLGIVNEPRKEIRNRFIDNPP